MKLKKEWVLTQLKAKGLGTGTLAVAAGVTPSDIQRLLYLEEAPDEIVRKIKSILGEKVIEESVEQPERGSTLQMSIAEIKAGVEAGDLSPAMVYETEWRSEEPRKTLLRWLEETYGLKE